jgi:hypothetical protein
VVYQPNGRQEWHLAWQAERQRGREKGPFLSTKASLEHTGVNKDKIEKETGNEK